MSCACCRRSIVTDEEIRDGARPHPRRRREPVGRAIAAAG